MRIIGGQNRGLRLAAVGKGDATAHLRPTTDRVRESLFNVLQNYLDFNGLNVLDLFAGTGALSFEAISRGAAQATLVENGRTGQKLIRENMTLLRCSDRCKLLLQDATKIGSGSQCDLIFIDPPYGKALGEKALLQAMAQRWIAPDALIVFEEATNVEPDGFSVEDTRKYGGTTITLLSPA